MPGSRTLDLASLFTKRHGVTEALGEVLAQCASVCLEQNGHLENAQIDVCGCFNEACTLSSLPVDGAMRRSFADLVEAVEHGAAGIAILVVESFEGRTVVQRAQIGTGCDYWIGSPDEAAADGENFLQHMTRLEVSGILKGSDGQRSARARQKLSQMARGDSSLPGLVVVVEFGRPIAQVERS